MSDDARAIRALLQRYASAVDVRDLAGVASCFTEDASYDGSLAGADVRAALADLASRWLDYEYTRHSLGFQLVELDHGARAGGVAGEAGADRMRAHADTWVSVEQVRRRDGRLESRRAVLCYRDDLVVRDGAKDEGGWRIVGRRVRTYFRLDWRALGHAR